MNFLRSLWRIWESFFSKERGINPGDLVARFIIDKRHYSPENKRVKPGAFFPEPTGETSVCIVETLSEEEIWAWGAQYVETNIRRIRARAELTAKVVSDARLTLLPDAPPPRHGKIVGWPREKDEQKAYALELAQGSVLKLRT